MNSPIVFYAHHGFADWEAGYILPILREKRQLVKVISEDGNLLESAGGFRILPEGDLKSLRPEQIRCLILPGGDSWMDDSKHGAVLDLTEKLLRDKNKTVAAICASTIGLARRGLLDQVNHTSNDLNVLQKAAPSYRGRMNYQKQLAVRHENLITASGIGALEFTLELLHRLNIDDEQSRRDWFSLNKRTPLTPNFSLKH